MKLVSLDHLSIRPIVVGLTLMCAACGSDEAELAAGEEIVNKNCKVCHAQGINGAPIVGNKKMWSQRLVRSEDEMIANAINGNGLMPPKGGKNHLSDDEIALAVRYLRSLVIN
jgi:cytochrome c5